MADIKIKNSLKRLAGSKFRSGIKLSEKDKEYFFKKGEKEIREQARNFILKRIAPALPKNDRRQTPWQGHPVFTAQHATATCCRNCLYNWHGIEKRRELNEQEIIFIIDLCLAWTRKEL